MNLGERIDRGSYVRNDSSSIGDTDLAVLGGDGSIRRLGGGGSDSIDGGSHGTGPVRIINGSGADVGASVLPDTESGHSDLDDNEQELDEPEGDQDALVPGTSATAFNVLTSHCC